MRTTVVAGIGGLLIGHILWLIAISLAVASTPPNTWVLISSAVCAVVALIVGLLGWRSHQGCASAKAAFLWCLPITPVLLSVIVLGVTYL